MLSLQKLFVSEEYSELPEMLLMVPQMLVDVIFP